MQHSWIEVNTARLKQNIDSLRTALPTQTEILFVVKADAYGHGAVELAKTASEQGIRWFAVAYLSEAIAIRKALPNVELLILGYSFPESVPDLIEHRVFPIITDCDHGLALAEAARALNVILPVHLKIDTGMGRFGVAWDEVESITETLQHAGGLEVAGACSHFAKVEPSDPEAAICQAERFKTATQALPDDVFLHLSSSRAALYFSDWDYNAVRQGIVLYGYGAQDEAGRFRTKPILQWKTRVAQVKRVPAGFAVGYYGTHITEQPTQIATLAVGYADGYNRRLSNRGNVLIGGRRCAVVGRVSMNWITVDLGPDASVAVGDEAVLLGEQGDESIWANELSAICQTIPYEILTSIHASLPRVYAG